MKKPHAAEHHPTCDMRCTPKHGRPVGRGNGGEEPSADLPGWRREKNIRCDRGYIWTPRHRSEGSVRVREYHLKASAYTSEAL